MGIILSSDQRQLLHLWSLGDHSTGCTEGAEKKIKNEEERKERAVASWETLTFSQRETEKCPDKKEEN